MTLQFSKGFWIWLHSYDFESCVAFCAVFRVGGFYYPSEKVCQEGLYTFTTLFCLFCRQDLFLSLMIYSSLKATILWYGIPRWNDTSIEGTPPLFFTNMWRCHLVITIAWKHLWFSGKTALSSCVSPCCMGSYPRLNEDKTILHVYKRDILLLSAHWRTVPFIGSTLHHNNKSVKIYLG